MLFGAAVATVAAGPASADDAATMLNTITVSGQSKEDPSKTTVVDSAESTTKTNTSILKSSEAVSVVTEKEIEKRNAQSLQQVIDYTSGVSTDEFGSDDRYDYFRIRGFSETTLGTYRDGLPARVPAWYTASRLEPYGLQEVQILKGSTSSLFGLNGPGGLVNAITKRPTVEPLHEIYTTFGTDKHLETGFDLSGPVAEGSPWSFRLTGKGQIATGGYEYSKDNRLYLAPAFTYEPDADTSFTFLSDFSKRDGMIARGIPSGSGIDPDTFLGEPDYNKFNTTQADVGYLFRHHFDNGLTFRQNARYSNVQLDYNDSYISSDPTGDREAFGVDGLSNRFAIDNQLQYDSTIGSVGSKFLLGTDFAYDSTHEDIVYGSISPIDIHDPHYCGLSCINLAPYVNWKVKQKALGIYGQEQLTFFDKLIVTGGLRYDYVNTKADYLIRQTSDNDTAHALTKRLGVTYLINSELSAYANYSESFQPLVAPTVNGYDTGETLKAQRGKQYEVGLKYRPDGFNGLFTLALFDVKQSNVPSYNVDYTVQRQIGEVRVRGVELEGKFELNDRWNATLAYSYWDGEIVGDGNSALVGNRPENVPKNIASAWLDYTIPGEGRRGDLTLGGGVRYIGPLYGDAENTAKVPGHAVVDAMVDYKITPHLDFSVNAKNLFDKEYVATSYGGVDFYGDGRSVLGTLKYTW